MPLTTFSEPTRAWFEASFPAPTPAQAGAWPVIATGAHTLVHAPTGSGKTLAAFLSALDLLLTSERPADRDAWCRVLYVSPLKALAYDIERNLRAPLAGIRHASERLGLGALPNVTVGLRTGDTPGAERQRMLRTPPDLLITTPESLYLLLTSRFADRLRHVETVIVDEVHAVAGTKRGAHLALTLERLTANAASPPQRVGLSATQRPLETIAHFLGGNDVSDDGIAPRPVEIVDAVADPDLEVDIRVTVDDMDAPPPDPEDAENTARSIWPSIYPELRRLVEAHTSTIIFANSRRLAERICNELNARSGIVLARAHHGSVSRDQRLEIEEALKRGELKAVVATSSLELGIDMGTVDQVLQVEAPPSVASGLQRAGRSGHHVGGMSKASIFPKHRGDLLVATAIADRMRHGAVEETRILRNPLDVLAQQVVAVVASGETTTDDLLLLVRGAAPYTTLGQGPFEAVLDMLAGRFPSDLFSELKGRITWNRLTGALAPVAGAHRLAVTNPGTIPDRGLYRVTLPDGTKVGELDEEMVYESRTGDSFILGASTWRIAAITHDRVEVIPAPGDAAARMPFWHGDRPGRPIGAGREVGRFIREIGSMEPKAAESLLVGDHHLDPLAAANLVRYLEAQQASTGVLPSDRTLVVERFLDEIGDWRVVIHSPLGSKVHAPWAMAVTHRLRERFGSDVDTIWSDDGLAFRFVETSRIPETDELFPSPDDLADALTEHLPDTALFSARFREAAARSLLLPRRRPGSRTPLWLQRRRSADLLAIARQFGTFPIVLETYREVLQDDFDLPSLEEVLSDVRARRIRVVDVETVTPSPFATSLVFAFVAAFLYDGDAPLAERKAGALALDRDLLRDLLGEAELRELLDPEVMQHIELELQRLVDSRKARHADEVWELLRSLGPLTTAGVTARTEIDDVSGMLADLERTSRLIRVTVAGKERWAAIEDAARLRDGLGVQPPAGVPHAFLEPVPDPLGDLVGRFARTHGPFSVSDAASHLHLPPAVILATLERLQPRVTRGAFRSGRSDPEWIDTGVLRRIKRGTLAALRSEIEPVDRAALARLTAAWQGVTPDPRARPIAEVLLPLEAIPIAASVWHSDILPSRTTLGVDTIDTALRSGEWLWAGRGALGNRDGRVALHRRDSWHALAPPHGELPVGAIHAQLRAHLSDRGASFFADLYSAAGGGDPSEVTDALWDLVWAGEVTNDSLAPVWERLRPTRRRTSRSPTARFGSDVQGRWSLLPDRGEGTPTGRKAAWARLLLERHGVVTRTTVAAEEVEGGFTSLYPVFSLMEEQGQVRRGYFVDGLGGAQFASPGAVDRLRAGAVPTTLLLAATDPANPYGSTLPWPDSIFRLARVPGAYVLLVDGELVAFVDHGRLSLLGSAPGDLARTLAVLGARQRRFEVREVDGVPVAGTKVGSALLAAGWRHTPKGLRP